MCLSVKPVRTSALRLLSLKKISDRSLAGRNSYNTYSRMMGEKQRPGSETGPERLLHQRHRAESPGWYMLPWEKLKALRGEWAAQSHHSLLLPVEEVLAQPSWRRKTFFLQGE